MWRRPEGRALWASFTVLVWMAESVSWTRGRNLLGEETTFSEADLKLLGVPNDAELLFQSEDSCGDPAPIQYRPLLALECQLNVKTRACLNVSSTVPFFRGICSGQRCTMDFAHEPSSCFLNSFGVEVDLRNATRNATCGFKPEDSHWLAPAVNPFALESMDGKPSCASSLTTEVGSELWAPCVNGEPQLRLRLAFEREMARIYTCVVAPTCVNATQRNRFVCFITKSQLLQNGEQNSASRPLSHVLFVVSTLTMFFILRLLPQ